MTTQAMLNKYLKDGWVMIGRVGNTVQLRKPKNNPSCLFFVFWLCIRCGQLNDNPFTLLCDDCHLDDEYHVSEQRKLENDHLSEISYARFGGAQ